jgi:hypothetical protein
MSSGWYTFEWVFRDNGGSLAVDLNLRDAGGTIVWTKVMTTSDNIATTVGGNRYMWFTFVSPLGSELAIDNSYMERNAAVSPDIASGSAFAKGSTIVTYTATDACGRTSSCSFDVVVVDDENPTVASIPSSGAAIVSYACGDMLTFNTDANSCVSSKTIIKPIWADNCTVVSSTVSANNGVVVSDFGAFVSGSFPKGITIVTFTGTDNSGNMSTCTLSIEVKDVTPPSIVNCPSNITVMAPTNACTAIVTWSPPPTAFDNCSGVTLVQTSSPTTGLGIGSAFPIGVTTILYIATDASGNTATCSFTVTVNGVCSNVTEFTPTFLIDASSFTVNQTRDAIFIVENISPSASNTDVVILITKPSGTFFNTSVPLVSGTAGVFGGIMSNNSEWSFQNFPSFIVCTKSTPIAAGASSIIALSFTATGVSNSQTQTTGQLLTGTGGDQNPNNNFAQSSLIIN